MERREAFGLKKNIELNVKDLYLNFKSIFPSNKKESPEVSNIRSVSLYKLII